MSIESFTVDLGNGRPITIETGKLAGQANGAITVQQGETILLVAAVASDPRPGQDFFPLQVDYREKYSAAGKFPGGFIKREGRPSDKEILTMRMTDRPLRPLFQKGFMDETQVYGLLLSYDGVNDADILNIFGASVALLISDIPYNTASAALRVGRINGEFVANPTIAELEESDLELIYVGTPGKTIMIEGDCDELSEEELRDALLFADEKVTYMVEAVEAFKAKVGKADKVSQLFVVSDELQTAVNEYCEAPLDKICRIPGKKDRNGAQKELFKEMSVVMKERFAEELDSSTPYLAMAFDQTVEHTVREMIRTEKVRMDGRGFDDIRGLECEAGVLPRVHGSSLFARGETQALVIATLGSDGDAQKVENPSQLMAKKFVLHYNFPNYSVGETGRIMGTSRREIGHGFLAERSVAKMMPVDYPYSVRCTSEVMSSNGSTSMASICGSSLALLDAGVPLRKQVAGITCGLISKEGEEPVLLADILGEEDHFGDMDFKVAGTRDGITGFQLDLKIAGLEIDIMYDALLRNKISRMTILDAMDACLAGPREEMNENAPQFASVKIEQDQIGALIGPGGKNIKAIVEDTQAKIDITDDGTVNIFAPSKESLESAQRYINGMVGDIEIGSEYEGKVTTIREFGAFVEILPGREGLVHISELAPQRINKVEDVCNLGDKIQVRVIGVDDRGKVSLSHKCFMEGGDTPAEPQVDLMDEIEEGAIERGIVVKILDFGAIVELPCGVTGMVHISELADYRVKSVEDICHMDDKITVKIIEIDRKRKRIKLSRKAAMAELD